MHQQILIALKSGSSGPVSLPASVTSTGSASSPWTQEFFTDGTTFNSFSTTPSVGNWYTPTTASIGSGYWIRFSNATGSSNISFTVFSWGWMQLNTARSIGLQSSDSEPANGGFTVEISSSSSGTPVLTTSNFSVTLT